MYVNYILLTLFKINHHLCTGKNTHADFLSNIFKFKDGCPYPNEKKQTNYPEFKIKVQKFMIL